MHPIDSLAPIALIVIVLGLTGLILWDPIVKLFRRWRGR
jgi:hypothetical protein